MFWRNYLDRDRLAAFKEKNILWLSPKLLDKRSSFHVFQSFGRSKLLGVFCFLLLIVSWPVLADSYWHSPRKVGDYVLWSSGVPDPREAPIFWIDDETLLFSGVPGEKVSDEKRYQEIVNSRLFTWKIGQRPQVFMANRWQSEKGSSLYCADYESIRFHDLMLGEEYHIAIINGKEVKTSAEEYRKYKYKKRELIKSLLPEKKDKDKYIGRGGSDSSARDYCPVRVDARMEGRYWSDDASGEYYIDRGSRVTNISTNSKIVKKNDNLYLIKQKTFESWDLDIPLGLIAQETLKHYTGTERFFVASRRPYQLGGASWQESNCWPFWLISTKSKQSEKFCIPYGEWSARGSYGFMDTRAGIFFYVHKPNPGLYFYNKGKPVKILDGWLGDARVSPSGCRIAFRSIPSALSYTFRQKFLMTHYVLDVCPPLKGK